MMKWEGGGREGWGILNCGPSQAAVLLEGECKTVVWGLWTRTYLDNDAAAAA